MWSNAILMLEKLRDLTLIDNIQRVRNAQKISNAAVSLIQTELYMWQVVFCCLRPKNSILGRTSSYWLLNNYDSEFPKIARKQHTYKKN